MGGAVIVSSAVSAVTVAGDDMILGGWLSEWNILDRTKHGSSWLRLV